MEIKLFHDSALGLYQTLSVGHPLLKVGLILAIEKALGSPFIDFLCLEVEPTAFSSVYRENTKDNTLSSPLQLYFPYLKTAVLSSLCIFFSGINYNNSFICHS